MQASGPCCWFAACRAELSSVPVTSSVVAPVPVCVMLPAWLTRFVACSVNWSALAVPWLLSKVAAESVSAPAAPSWPAFVSVVPAEALTLPFAARVPLLNSVCTAAAIRFWTAVIEPAFAICPACTVTLPLPPMVPPRAARAVVQQAGRAASVSPSASSDATCPAVLSNEPALAVSAPAACIVPPAFESLLPRRFRKRTVRNDLPVAVGQRARRDGHAHRPRTIAPLSLVSVPAARASSVPPAVIVAPDRFRSPPLAASSSAPLADVLLPGEIDRRAAHGRVAARHVAAGRGKRRRPKRHIQVARLRQRAVAVHA